MERYIKLIYLFLKVWYHQYFQEPFGCESCREGLSTLFENWTVPGAIKAEEEYLIAFICRDHIHDPAKCSVGVRTWWGKLAKIIFSDESGLLYCNAMNANCTLPEVK